jgi:hypothetical protein
MPSNAWGVIALVIVVIFILAVLRFFFAAV